MRELPPERLLGPDRPANPMWDALWQAKPTGGIAAGVFPSAERVERVKDRVRVALADDAPRPPRWHESWRESLADSLYHLAAGLELPGDRYPALAVPRWLHGQSQGIADLFGCRLTTQPDGNVYVHPLPANPAAIDAIEPAPLESSAYWGAVEWVRYARAATRGCVDIRMPITTGPLDTACYLLGPAVALEWVYAQPRTLHGLLGKITDATIGLIAALRQAAGGTVQPHHMVCMRGGFDLASEVRSIVSREVHEEFDAPCLRRIGEKCGPFGVHSCGSWERTVPIALGDSNLRAMNGQIRENDLATLCAQAGGRIALSIGRSVDVHARYTWPSQESYLRHVLATVPKDQPLEVWFGEADLPLWNRLHREVRGEPSALPTPASGPT